MKKIYEIYLDNIRNGIIIEDEIDSLENEIKQLEFNIKFLKRELNYKD